MWTVFKREFQDSIFSGTFLIAFIVMTAAFLVSMGMMYQEYSGRMENYEDSFSLKGQDLFWNKVFFWRDPEGRFTNSSDTVTFPMGLVKAPGPLLFIARGLDKQMRQSVEFVDTFPIIDISVKPEQETNLLKIAFEAPDYLFILKVLVSLLAILFSYNLACSERERGTLKLLMVNGTSRTSIFAGKFFGSLSALWVAFVGAYIIYVLSILMLTPVGPQEEIGVRLLLVMITSLLHIAVFFAIGAMLSTFFRESAPSLIVSLFVWLIIVFALPGLSALLAQQFVPVDSDEKVARTKLETAQQMEQDYAEANPDDNNISNTAGYGRRHDAIRDQVNAEMKKIDDQHALQRQRQAELTTSLSRISPVGSVTYLITSLANNGLEDVKLYKNDLIRIRDKINEEVTKMLTDPEFGREYVAAGFDMPERASEAIYELFDYGHKQGFSRLSLEDSLEHAVLDYFLIVMFAVIPAAIGFVRFMFYDPR